MAKQAGPALAKNIVTVTRGAVASKAYAQGVGRFVELDSDEYVTPCTTASTAIFGFVQNINITTDSTDGNTKLAVDVSDGPWWLKADATVTEDLIGKTCDLIATTGGNLADIGASTNDIIEILDVDVSNQMVLARIAEGKRQVSGVA